MTTTPLPAVPRNEAFARLFAANQQNTSNSSQDEPDRYGWLDFEEDEADYIPGKYILTILDGDEEFAIIVHRTVDGKYPLDGEVAEEKRDRARQIVALLNESAR